MSKNWYYEKNGTKHGPVSHEELKKLVFDGELRSDERVSNDGKRWRPAKQVTGLPPRQPSGIKGAADSSTTSLTPAVKYAAIGCGGLLLMMVFCIGIIPMAARIIDPEGFANIRAGKNRDGSERSEPDSQVPAISDGDRHFDKAEALNETIYSASKLFLDFEGNEVAANQSYKGKTIVVDGVVHDIEAGGFMSGVTVNLRKHFDARGTRCELTSAEGTSDTLRDLAVGSRVQIRGYCEGFTGVTVRMKNCEIIK
ncbi:OB-fold protein [Novipirellula sp. SH528]|uniref:OB-fold protein n=1 Tax=Novipirellula sp. SH528 TaxID=3454466 RepID=UPI003FA038FC